MRILVTGGEGQLGNCLQMAVAKSSNEYIFTDVDDIDITDPEAVELGVKVNDFQLIVNCAAFTDVDRAERQEDIAEMINATAAGYLAKAAKDNGIPMICISTDYVSEAISATLHAERMNLSTRQEPTDVPSSTAKRPSWQAAAAI